MPALDTRAQTGLPPHSRLALVSMQLGKLCSRDAQRQNCWLQRRHNIAVIGISPTRELHHI